MGKTTGKNKRRQLEQFDDFHNVKILCDSQEEVDFIAWCSEAAQLGIIIDYEYQPEAFQLFDPVTCINSKGKKYSLLRKHSYSADFIIQFNPQTSRMLIDEFKIPYDKISSNNVKVYLDIKGTFQRNGTGRSFSINQKWVYQKYQIYIQKLIPIEFFKKCGCPMKCFRSLKTNKPRPMFKGFMTIPYVFKIEKKS